MYTLAMHTLCGRRHFLCPARARAPSVLPPPSGTPAPDTAEIRADGSAVGLLYDPETCVRCHHACMSPHAVWATSFPLPRAPARLVSCLPQAERPPPIRPKSESTAAPWRLPAPTRSHGRACAIARPHPQPVTRVRAQPGSRPGAQCAQGRAGSGPTGQPWGPMCV